MSFQGFQGSVDTSGANTFASSSAEEHLRATKARIAVIKAAEEQKRIDASANNRTSTGLILDTNKAAGGASNIPSSKFTIFGGKAVNKVNVGRNISSSIPSIRTRDGRRLTADSPNLTDAQKQALGIFSGQHAVTRRVANDFSSERRAQQLSGKTIAEANQIASGIQTNPLSATNFKDRQIGVTKQDQNTINTVLQTDIIRSNNAKLNFANELIRRQTTIGEANTLDDLEAQLANAPNQNLPIQNIDVSTDEFGNVVSPRNVKLQIENAGLTGGLTEPVLNVITSGGVAPNAEEIAQVIREGLAEATGNAQVDGLTSVTTNPDGTINIAFSEFTPEIFRQQFGDIVFEAVGRFFDLRDQGVDDFFSNPEGLRIKIGEEVSLGGSGGGNFASGLLDEKGFDFLGLLSNPIFIIAIVAVVGIGIFLRVKK